MGIRGYTLSVWISGEGRVIVEGECVRGDNVGVDGARTVRQG